MAVITIRFSGPIRRPWPEMTGQVEVESETTVRGVLRVLGYAAHEHRFLLTAVNGDSVGLSHEVGEGDTLDVALRAGGG